MTWQFWGIFVRCIVGCFYWGVGICFSLEKIRVLGFRKKTTEVKYHFHRILSMVHTVNMIYDCWCWPGSPGWGSVCLVFPFPCCACWEQLVLTEWEMSPAPPKVECLHNLLESLLHAREVCLFSSVCIFKSFIYISMFSWIFILCFELESNITLFVAKIVTALALGSSFSWLMCLWHSLINVGFSGFVGFFERFFIFCHYKMLQTHMVHFLPQSWDQLFLQGAFILLTGEWNQEPWSEC